MRAEQPITEVDTLWARTKRRFWRDASDHIRYVIHERRYLSEATLAQLEKSHSSMSVSHLYRAWHDSGLGRLDVTDERRPFSLSRD